MAVTDSSLKCYLPQGTLQAKKLKSLKLKEEGKENGKEEEEEEKEKAIFFQLAEKIQYLLNFKFFSHT